MMKKSVDDKNTGLHLLENKRSGKDTMKGKNHVHPDPICYLKAVKYAFPKEGNKYKEFEGLLVDYKARRIDLATLKARVKEFFGEHKSLLLGFNTFLPKDHQISLPPENDGHADDTVKLAALFTDSPVLQLVTQLLPDYQTEAALQNPQPAVHPTLPCNDSVADNARQDGVRDKDFKKHRPDIQDCERCTPSYCLLPEDYQIPLASYRKEDDILVLNDHLVAVTSGSKDCPFVITRKNEYERILFRCEDDQFELDILLETMNAAITRVEKLLKDIENEDNPICLEDHLTAGDIGCIGRLYGEHCFKVMDFLRKKPSVVLPVVLSRLKQKKEELGRGRTDFNVRRAEEYAKYHHRSLDYCSSYFKNQDMNSLSTKALLAGIKKFMGIECKKGCVLPSLSDGKEQHSLTSQLELEYSDPDIHYDIYQLIRYSHARNYTQQHMDKVVSIWKHFLEPMLGVPTRPEDTDAHSKAEESAHTLSNEWRERARGISDEGDGDGDSDCGVLGSECSDGEKHSHEDPDEEDVNDNKAEETFDGQDVEYSGLLPFTDCFLHKAKPVTKCMPQASQRDNDSQLFYGNDSFYVLFMLHYILYERLKKAKFYSSSDSKQWRIGDDDTDSADRYARFMSALYNLLDGSFEQEKFEKECLTILGPESYVLFTLDKLILRILSQLHGIANREINREVIQLYANESARKPWTSMDNNNYIENVRRLLSDKNIFRLEYVPAAAQLSIQLMKLRVDEAVQLMKLCIDEADEEGYDGDGED